MTASTPANYNFDGKVVLITGAGQGIAAAAAEALASQGAKVGVGDRVPERAHATTARIGEAGGDALALAFDVSDEPQVERAVQALVDRYGRIDVLINAAGSYGKAFRKTHETPTDEWEHVFASNVRGTFQCSKAVLPHMLKAGKGRIVNVSSNAGRSVSPLLGCSYTAAKSAVIGISRHLSREYARSGILVNTLCPGPVDGHRVSDLLPEANAFSQLAETIPIGRLLTNDDIVAGLLFLASDSCQAMTGAVLDVSGGLILG